MNIECCGKTRSTPFCPECGRPLTGDVNLRGLLVHCRTAERKNRTEAGKCRVCPGKDNPAVIRRGARFDESAAKWKAWGDALRDLLERSARAPA